MVTNQHRNVVTGVLVAVVAVLSALVVVTAIAQMYAATVGLILGQLMSLSAIGYIYIKAREQRNELFCAQLTVNKYAEAGH